MARLRSMCMSVVKVAVVVNSPSNVSLLEVVVVVFIWPYRIIVQVYR